MKEYHGQKLLRLQKRREGIQEYKRNHRRAKGNADRAAVKWHRRRGVDIGLSKEEKIQAVAEARRLKAMGVL